MRANRDHHGHQYYVDYGPPELPRRLFRQLSPSGAEALPLLRFLYTSSAQQLTRPPDVNSHNGYALARAVSARAVPLVRFLLDHGAAPRHMDALAIRIAIGRRDLALVRLLIERQETPRDKRRTGKRRKLADRIQVTSEMLKLAVLCGTHDIVEYFMNEKGSVPDVGTLKLLRWGQVFTFGRWNC
jgi:ankyrin repeat protein